MKHAGRSVVLAAVVAACVGDIGPQGQPKLVLFPLLDSMFVGDRLPPRQITYFDKDGNAVAPGPVAWVSSDTLILTVDSAGRVTGQRRGTALVVARAHDVLGSALVAVAEPLQVTLLLDSLILMPGDTFTIPAHVDHLAPGTPTVWFTAAANAVMDLDSASGRDSGKAAGGPVPFVVHAALGADTVADSGTVEVLQLTDTIGGKAAFTIFGTVIRDRKMPARALNFHRRGDTLTFRLRSAVTQSGTTVELVAITLKTPPAGPGVYAIDSIGEFEAAGGTADPFCRPPRNWGMWSVVTSQSTLQAVSRSGGYIAITQMVPVANGMAISGRFAFFAQRFDLYDDPLARLPIRGTFVAPLITTTPRCE